LWADLRTFARERSRVQWIAAALAILMPLLIIAAFVKDGKTNIMPGEQIIYAESWRADRSDEEIRAAQKVYQARQEAIAAERQRQFQILENKFGM
jgi:hypothetical protein